MRLRIYKMRRHMPKMVTLSQQVCAAPAIFNQPGYWDNVYHFLNFAALIGGGFSIFMRMELMEPGVQYMADGHVWNVFTTAHGLIMVFLL